MDTKENVTVDSTKQFNLKDYVIRHEVVCISGSTRFKDKILEVARDLTLQGYIVLLPLVFGHSGDAVMPEQKEMLDELHFAKIDMAQFLYVVNPFGYVGESTLNEIEYAKSKGKTIIYLEDME